MTISLFKAFAVGMIDYIQQHNANYTAIESALNDLTSLITGQVGGQATVPLGLQEIFDRRGLIGVGSYDFDEGVLSGPDYNFTVQPGAYYNAGAFYRRTSTIVLTMSGRSTGTYYLNLDALGNPVVGTYADASTTRQFSWNATTHTIADKALYTGVSVLFDGDDYADMLTSAAKAKSYTKVADRLEEIEAGVDVFGGHYAQDLPHSGLNFKYKGPLTDDKSQVRNDSTITETAAGQVLLTASQTNYIEVDPATGTVSANIVGFTSGKIPLYVAVTGASSITSVSDKRTPAIAGTGGGGGGHTQGTDLGTTASTFTIDTDATGSPTGRAGIAVENGDDPNAELKFNRDTDKWQWTVDGGLTWHDIDEVNLDLGSQELSKYISKENPDLALEDLARGSSTDYEDLDLSSYVDAPQGVVAVALRIVYWDTADGADYNVKFKKKGSAYSPAAAYTVYTPARKDLSRPQFLIVPVDSNVECQFFVTASGVDTSNIRVYLVGYFAKVTGVGTQAKTLSRGPISVPAGTAVDTSMPGVNRGLAHYLKVEETGGLITAGYDIALYSSSYIPANLIYKAEGIDPATDYEDWLPFWVADKDLTHTFLLRLTNHDTGAQATFTVTINCEQFN